jgi:hypothetical protein
MQSFFPVRILYVCLTELLCKQVYLDELCFTSVVKKQILSFKVYLKKLFSKKLFSKISLKKMELKYLKKVYQPGPMYF